MISNFALVLSLGKLSMAIYNFINEHSSITKSELMEFTY